MEQKKQVDYTTKDGKSQKVTTINQKKWRSILKGTATDKASWAT